MAHPFARNLLPLIALAAGCTSPEGRLTVSLVTDVVSVADFSAIEIALRTPDTNEVVASTRREVHAGEVFRGEPTARLLGISPGEYVVSLTLVEADGSAVVDAEARASVAASPVDGAVTVLIDRGCVGVRCPSGELCQEGSCRPRGCVLDPATCAPVPPECTEASECTGATACTDPACVQGRCFALDRGDCTAGEYCDAEAGCTPYATDSVCGRPCTELPCQLGYWHCAEGEAPVCRPFNPLAAGQPCEGGVCDGDGRCVACVTGMRCSTTNPCEFGRMVCEGGPRCMGMGPRDAGWVCREQAGVCDVVEVCDGTSLGCPADAVVARDVECRPSMGACDPAEVCDGTSAACPADDRAPSTEVCRPAREVCDVPETCDGTGAECPTDTVRPSTFVCRAAGASECDAAETCTGVTAACPPDVFAPSGTVCSAGACDRRGVCAIDEDCTFRFHVDRSSGVASARAGTAGIALLDAEGNLQVLSADGLPAWSRSGLRPFGLSGSSRLLLLERVSGFSSSFDVVDFATGASRASLTHTRDATGWLAAANGAVAEDGSVILALNASHAGGTWTVTPTGAGLLSGSAPATVVFQHGPTGSYVRSWPGSLVGAGLLPMVLVDGRVVARTPGSPSLRVFGSTTTTTTLPFTPQAAAHVTGTNQVVMTSFAGGTILLEGTTPTWMRPDCGGTFVGATGSRVLVAGHTTATFCGQPLPVGAEGVAMAWLDRGTGATLDTVYFASTPPSLLRDGIASNGDAYFVFPRGATVCGASRTSASVVGF